MLRVEQLYRVQRGTIFAVYIRGVGKRVFCLKDVAAMKEFLVSISWNKPIGRRALTRSFN